MRNGFMELTSLLGWIKEMLEKFTYYEFQKPTVTYITSVYAILGVIKEQITQCT